MEEEMTSQRIPNTDSIEELSKFRDSHDLTDFENQLEEVRTPVFARRKESMVAVLLTPHRSWHTANAMGGLAELAARG